jgi:hypothetical protein
MKNNSNILEGGTVLGVMKKMAFIGFISVILIIFGFSLIKKYNKPTSKKIFAQMTGGQYIGIIFTVLGLIPFIQFFLQGVIFQTGKYTFNSIKK